MHSYFLFGTQQGLPWKPTDLCKSRLSTYSGTPPYDHPVYKTTSLLRPYSFKPNVKTIESFYYFEDPVNATTSLLRPGFYDQTVVALSGFHCNEPFEGIFRESKIWYKSQESGLGMMQLGFGLGTSLPNFQVFSSLSASC